MKTSKGRIIVDIAPTETIGRMKEIIQKVRGIVMDKYEIVFNGNVLRDGTTLLENRLMNGDTIFLVRHSEEKGKFTNN